MSIKKKSTLTQKRLKELYEYSPDTGIFTKLVSSGGYKEGHIPACVNAVGYITINIDYKRYTAHRLAWLYMEGYFPEHDIDHINNVKTDTRWCNLREASRSCNMRNTPISKSNTTGVKGVYYDRKRDKWLAGIKVNYISHHLCMTEDFVEAVAHRLAAEDCFDWHVCRKESSAYQYMQKYLNGELDDKTSN